MEYEKLMDKGQLLDQCCVQLGQEVTQAMASCGAFIEVLLLPLLEEVVIFSKLA